MPPDTPPQAVDAFIAFLILGLVAITLIIMGGLWLLDVVQTRLGWADSASTPSSRPRGQGHRHSTNTGQLSRTGALSFAGAGTPLRPVDTSSSVSADSRQVVLDRRIMPVPAGTQLDRTQDTSVGPLRTTDWLTLVNDRPDAAPHLVIVGGTGTGKTTLATALLATRSGQVLIVTPKPDDDWGGLPAVTIDDDGSFTTAAAVFSQLLAEVRRRLVATKRTIEPGPWLNVVLDDYPALRNVCPDAGPAFELIAQLGRSLRVRLIVLSYSGLVKELGLEGKGESRNHFVWVRLDRQRRATLDWDSETLILDTREVPSLARQPLASSRWWTPPPTTTTAPASSETPLGLPHRTITTTTTTALEGRESPAEDGVVVVVVDREGVTVAEQVSILSAAIRMQLAGERVGRVEVCRQVFDGQTGGAAFRKTKAVLDAAGL